MHHERHRRFACRFRCSLFSLASLPARGAVQSQQWTSPFRPSASPAIFITSAAKTSPPTSSPRPRPHPHQLEPRSLACRSSSKASNRSASASATSRSCSSATRTTITAPAARASCSSPARSTRSWTATCRWWSRAAKATSSTARRKTCSYPPAHVDRVLHDGDTVQLGGTVLTAHLTAGHTRGTTTWTMDETEGGRMLHVVIVGSPNVNPGYKLVGNKAYPQIAADYKRGFAVLKRAALRHLSRRARRLFRPDGKIRALEGRRPRRLHRSQWIQSVRGRSRAGIRGGVERQSVKKEISQTSIRCASTAVARAIVTPRSRNTLLRDSSPDTSSTALFGKPNISARNAISAAFARPFQRRSLHGDLELRCRAFAVDARDGCLSLRPAARAPPASLRPSPRAASVDSDSWLRRSCGVRLPNSAVPMRMRVAPSANGQRKIAAHPHRQHIELQVRVRRGPAIPPHAQVCESTPASHPPPRPTAQSSSARALQDSANPAAAPAAAPPRPTPARRPSSSLRGSASPRSAPAAACRTCPPLHSIARPAAPNPANRRRQKAPPPAPPCSTANAR